MLMNKDYRVIFEQHSEDANVLGSSYTFVSYDLDNIFSSVNAFSAPRESIIVREVAPRERMMSNLNQKLCDYPYIWKELADL
jgi:hypothetical protein